MVEREIRVRTTDGDMTTFVVRPDGDGPFPVAVVFMLGHVLIHLDEPLAPARRSPVLAALAYDVTSTASAQ